MQESRYARQIKFFLVYYNIKDSLYHEKSNAFLHSDWEKLDRFFTIFIDYYSIYSFFFTRPESSPVAHSPGLKLDLFKNVMQTDQERIHLFDLLDTIFYKFKKCLENIHNGYEKYILENQRFNYHYFINEHIDIILFYLFHKTFAAKLTMVYINLLNLDKKTFDNTMSKCDVVLTTKSVCDLVERKQVNLDTTKGISMLLLLSRGQRMK